MASHVVTDAPRYSASVLDSAIPRDRGAPKRERESECGSAIADVSSPIGIHVIDELFGKTDLI